MSAKGTLNRLFIFEVKDQIVFWTEDAGHAADIVHRFEANGGRVKSEVQILCTKYIITAAPKEEQPQRVDLLKL